MSLRVKRRLDPISDPISFQIKPENDNSGPQEDDSGRKRTSLRFGKLRLGTQLMGHGWKSSCDR